LITIANHQIKPSLNEAVCGRWLGSGEEVQEMVHTILRNNVIFHFVVSKKGLHVLFDLRTYKLIKSDEWIWKGQL
jgi:hypothetical protein